MRPKQKKSRQGLIRLELENTQTSPSGGNNWELINNKITMKPEKV